MPYIKVNLNSLNQLESQLNQLPNYITSTRSAIKSVRNNLDWDVADEENIDRRLRNIISNLDKYHQSVCDTVILLNNAIKQYDQTEKNNCPSTLIPTSKYGATYITAIAPSVAESNQEAYEKREQTAKTWKWVVGGLCAVGSIALIIGTGGAATPLVVGAVSAVIGAAMAATEHLADEYVETGTLATTDWKEFGTDVVIGGAVGFATGYIGAGVGNAVTTKLSTTVLHTGLCSTNTLTRAGTNAVIGSVSEISSGIVSRGTGAVITGVTEKDINLGEIASTAFNPTNIMYDAAVGGATSAFNEILITKKDTARYEQHLKDMQNADHLTPGMNADDYTKYQVASQKQEFISNEQIRYEQHLKDIQGMEHLTPGMTANDYVKFQNASEQLDQLRVNETIQDALNYKDTSNLTDFATDNSTVIDTLTPELRNYEWRELYGYESPPYDYNYVVKKVEAGDFEYVRVYDEIGSGKLGRWFALKSDIEGLTPLEIKDRYALQHIPTKICDVNIPQNQELYTGITGKAVHPTTKELWGNGGGQQFETGGESFPEEWFINERRLE